MNGFAGKEQESGSYKEIWNPDLPPDASYGMDDEFDVVVDNARIPYLTTHDALGKWTPQAATTIAREKTGMRISGGGIYQAMPAAGDFTAWTRFSISGQPTIVNYQYAGIFVQTGAGQVLTIGLTHLNTNVVKLEVMNLSSWHVWSSTPVGVACWETHAYVSVRRSGLSMEFWYSQDGLGYARLYAINLASDRVGIFGTGAPGTGSAFFQFFRFVPLFIGGHAALPGNTQRLYY